MFSKNEKCVESMKEWQMKIGSDPEKCEGHKYDAGNLLMGNRNSFPIENCGDIDRKI